MDKAIDFPGRYAEDSDKIYDACIVINSIWTILAGILVLAVPFYIAVGSFKNNFAPAVKEFYIHILHILVGRTFNLHFSGGRKIARMQQVVQSASIRRKYIWNIIDKACIHTGKNRRAAFV